MAATTAPKAASTILRRGLLYVPASSPKFLDKSRSLSSDNITYDLEDSVTPTKKPEARALLRDFLAQPRPKGIREVAVRINSIDTPYALADLTELANAPSLDAVVIPKVNSPADLSFVTDALRHLRGPDKPLPRLIALVESARALTDLNAICASSKILSGLVFAAEDFAQDLSITRTPSLTEFLFARSAIVTAARAHNVPSVIDLVCTQFRGEQGLAALREECESGKRLGFTGKQLIHPSQVAVAEEVYSPSPAEVEWAVRCTIADEKADEQGRAAWTLDGKMIDVPVVRKARDIVGKAEACGVDLGELRERFRDVVPEAFAPKFKA